MKKTAALTALLFISSCAHSEQRFKPAMSHQLACNTVYEANRAYENRMQSNDVPEQIPQGCQALRPDQTFAVANGDTKSDGVKTVVNIANSSTYMAYVAGPIEKVAETREPVDNKCKAGDWMPSGEVDRLVAGNDGTLKLKRFMVTNSCVNGRIRSTTKPLN